MIPEFSSSPISRSSTFRQSHEALGINLARHAASVSYPFISPVMRSSSVDGLTRSEVVGSKVVGSNLESCMLVNSARSVAQGAEASPGYCTPSRVSRQHVCRNSPGMIDQDRRHEVSGDRSYSELARSFRRRQKRW